MVPLIPLPPRPDDALLAATPAPVLEYLLALEKLVRQLTQRLSELDQRVSELEQTVREAKRQATPFRRRKKKDKSRHQKPGRKGGHPAEHRAAVDQIDEHCDAPLAACPCGHADIEELYSYEQTQEDLELRRVVRKLVVHVGRCGGCGAVVEGHHRWKCSSAQGAAAHHLGPTALALTAMLHYEQGVPFERLAALLDTLGLARVSKATLVRAMERVGDRAQATFQELLAKVLEQEVLHIDETGWSLQGEACYLWVLTGGGYTVYFVRQTRSSDEVADFLQDFAGVLVTDGAPAYDKLGLKLLRALCLLHLKRNMIALEAKTTGRGKVLPRALTQWLTDAIALVGQRGALDARVFHRRATELEDAFFVLLETSPTNPASARMIERLIAWQDSVLLCLWDPAVPATNNHGERQIRPAVVLRKRGGCNRSERGARTFERLSSLAATAREQKADFITWVSRLLCQPVAHAALAFW